jgi:hypothetical protein
MKELELTVRMDYRFLKFSHNDLGYAPLSIIKMNIKQRGYSGTSQKWPVLNPHGYIIEEQSL